MRCPNCNGKGTIIIERDVENGLIEPDIIECSECKGTGVKP
jgi:DnaJ-class molecular chaperone